MILSPGDRVDRYEVIELLGAGGMGEVYRARDPKLARLVALKILRIDSSPGTDGAARLLREARAAAALSHANVLAVFDVGEVQEPAALRGLAYIAMELVEGRSLRTYLGDESVSLERRVGWLREIALALGAAHQVGIVHRDVKLENVMIRVDGAVKVLDFGIARRNKVAFDAWSSTQGHSLSSATGGLGGSSTLTAEGAIVGTPLFMAPEQLRGEVLDGRTDQFSWGVVAYALLTGQTPWKEASEPIAVLSQILSFDPPSPREVAPRIPVAVSNAITRALAKVRGDRFDSMEALVRALDGKLPEPVAPDLHTTLPSAARPSQDHPRPGGGRSVTRWAVGVAGLVVAGSVLLGWRARRAERGAIVGDAALTSLPVGECTSNRECAQSHREGAWHCHRQRHVCVDLASPDCKVYAEPHAAEADDVVWIGGLFPLSTDPGLLCEMRATELAREDFAQTLGASSGRAGALHARPIGLVICDESASPARAAHHLVDDVEAPAVIGFRSTPLALTTIPTVFLPARVLSFVTISQAPAITKIPEPAGEPRLVWRSTLNHDDAAPPLAHLISDVLEPAARAAPGGIGSRPFKVAVVLPTTYGHDAVAALFKVLRFNGRSALENGESFRQFVYDVAPDAGAGDTVEALLAFAPQAIVVAGPPFLTRMLPALEARWPGGLRPSYLTESSFPAAPIAAFAGRDPARRRRFLSDTNLSTTMTNAQLVLRYNLAFPAEPIVRSAAPQPSYDAFYMLAYAVYSLGDAAVTGPALSGALHRLLPPGPKVDVGPAQILEAFETLRSAPEARIDLNGAIGSLDFDDATGEAPIDYAIICPGIDDRGVASELVDSGLVYDARAKRFVGELRCP